MNEQPHDQASTATGPACPHSEAAPLPGSASSSDGEVSEGALTPGANFRPNRRHAPVAHRPAGSRQADDHGEPSARGRLAFLTKCFPRISETFILNEILELERQGLDLRVYSMISPQEEKRHRRADDVRSAVLYMPYPLLPAGGRYAAAHLKLLRRAPLRYLRTMLAVAVSCDLDLMERFVQAGLLAEWLRRDGVDHVHAGFVHAPGSVAWLVHRITGIPFSVATHAKDLYHSPPRLLRKKLMDASLVLTCTQYNVEHFQSVGLAERMRRLRRVYHGTDLELFPFGPLATSTPPVVLCVARLVEKKGLATLVAACALLRDRGRSFACRIIGEGPLRQALLQQIHTSGLEGNVKLEGTLHQDEVRQWYRRARVLALPSMITEDGDRDGIPNVLVEGAACGVPVVSTPVSGIPELVKHEQTGLVVPAGDAPALAAAIERLFDEDELCERLRSGARELVEKEFDLRRNAGVIAGELTAVMGAHAASPREARKVSNHK